LHSRCRGRLSDTVHLAPTGFEAVKLLLIRIIERVTGRHNLRVRRDLLGRCVMTVSGISSPPNSYQPSTQQSQFQKIFGQLVQQIQAGNLSGAQQTYSELTQLQNQGQGPSPNSQLAQLLGQIGQSLQNGNVDGAQQALQSSPRSHGGHRHHHGGHSSTSSSSATGSTTANTTTTNTLTQGAGANINVTA
jgi:hypothetical protein